MTDAVQNTVRAAQGIRQLQDILAPGQLPPMTTPMIDPSTGLDMNIGMPTMQPPQPIRNRTRPSRKVSANENILQTENDNLKARLKDAEAGKEDFEAKLNQAYKMLQEYSSSLEEDMDTMAEKVGERLFELQNKVFEILSDRSSGESPTE